MKMLTCPNRRLLCAGAEIINAQATAATTSCRLRASVLSTPPSAYAMTATVAQVATSQSTCSTGSGTRPIGQSTSAANGG
jgi:hypothetical protein